MRILTMLITNIIVAIIILVMAVYAFVAIYGWLTLTGVFALGGISQFMLWYEGYSMSKQHDDDSLSAAVERAKREGE